MSEENKKSLVTRYYTWELSVLITSLLLIFWQIFGLNDAVSLPLLDVKLRDPSKFPLVTIIILLAEFFFLLIEWNQSAEVARHSFSAKFRLSFVVVLAVIGVWINLPTLTKGTALADVSRFWYLFYLFIGLSVGALMSTLIFATLMIRVEKSETTTPLPKIPVATKCVYMGCWPMALILLLISYMVSTHAPLSVLQVAPWVTAIPILYFVVEEIRSLFFSYDTEGHRVPMHQRISKLKEIFATHDYLYYLNRHGRQVSAQVPKPSKATPQQEQQAYRQHFAKDGENVMLRTRTLEEFEFVLCYIDGNSKNEAPDNVFVQIKLLDPEAKALKVQVWPKEENPPTSLKEMTLKVSLLEKHANDFLKKNFKTPVKENAWFSYTIDNSVADTLMEEAGHGFPLQAAAFSGRQDVIEDFLAKGKDINEQAGNGWTPLLAAVAQGYLKMVKFMLERGANPDTSNLQGITPLMYAARYGNVEIAKLLLNYGAKLDLQDIFGDTALAVAVTRGQESLVRLFISKGAKTDTRNKIEKLTPLELAHKHGHGEIARLLRKQSSRSNPGN